MVITFHSEVRFWRARYYTLAPAGRKQLAAERQRFDRLITAIRKVISQK